MKFAKNIDLKHSRHFWGGRREGGDTPVADSRQKPTQYYKAIILQLRINKILKWQLCEVIEVLMNLLQASFCTCKCIKSSFVHLKLTQCDMSTATQ